MNDMENEKWHKIIGSFLRENSHLFLIFGGFIGIFSVVFWLYDLETEAVFYASLLCLLLALTLLSIHFIFYVRDHRERMRVLKNIRLLLDGLPEPKTLAEKDLQAMTHALKHDLEMTETQWQTERKESLDYYTTWVHQIKTPISAMKMVLESEDTSEHRELLAELFRIEQYVEMVLSFLRLSSESSDYVFMEYDLDRIIRQAIRKYASQFVRRKIRLEYEGTDKRVLTDEKWLQFIIEQILSNSIKYTPQGSVTITVTQDHILKIADTGIGIASEDVPRIFEKGFTGYNGRLQKKSTGLGLYLCKQAADRLCHKIWVESIPGAGTAVFLDLHSNHLVLE